jgi:enterochelin esterase-like enzyme
MKNILLLAGFLVPFFLFAQTPAPVPTVSSGSIVRIEALASKYVPVRPIDVWLPAGYTPTQKYTVLYMQDGSMLFDPTHTWTKTEWKVDEVLGALLAEGKVQPCIVVAIHTQGLGRFEEYWPQKPWESLTAKDRDYVLNYAKTKWNVSLTCRSDAYLKYVVQEVKPYIDSAFSTLPDVAHTYVAGSSFGGLISLYAMSEYPKVFGGAACLSTHWPGVFEYNDAVAESFYQYVSKHLPSAANHKLYMDYGDQGLDTLYSRYQSKVTKLANQKGYRGTEGMFRFYPGAAHTEASWAERLQTPLLFLLGNGTGKEVFKK